MAEVIAAIGMRAHCPLPLERFGDGELEGWSALQFIETSSITVHADEVVGRCFVDIFSCQPLDAQRGRDRRRALRRRIGREGFWSDDRCRARARRAGGLVGIAGTIPYVGDTLRGTTRPHRGTWLIWSVLAIVVCLSQRADGATWSVLMAGAEAALKARIFLLASASARVPSSAPETVLIAIATVGVAGWLIADEPIVATACVVAADLIATGMMLPKTWRDPDPRPWRRSPSRALAAPLAAGAVGVLEAGAAPVSPLLLPGQRGTGDPHPPPAGRPRD